MALIDAVELAERLTPEVARSVRGYQAARRRHTGLYQFISALAHAAVPVERLAGARWSATGSSPRAPRTPGRGRWPPLS